MNNKICMLLIIIFCTSQAHAGTSIFDRGPAADAEDAQRAASKTNSAEQMFVSGDYEGVLRAGSAYLDKHPKGGGRIRCLVGRALLKLKRMGDARGHFEKVLEESSNKKYFAEANIGIADSYYLEGEYRQAREYYEKVARLFPDSDSLNIVYYRLSECYSKIDNEAMAKEYCDRLLRLYPDSLEAKLLKGEGSGFIKYSVQVGSFSKRENAERLREELKERGFEADIQTITVNNGPFYRVRVGDYTRVRDAEDMAKNLQSKGYITKVCP